MADVCGEGYVLADGEVGEEDGSLGGVGEVAAVGGEACVGSLLLLPAVGGSVGEVHEGVGEEAAGGAEDGAFAAAGGAEEDGPGCGEGQVGGEVEGAKLGVDAEGVVGISQSLTSVGRGRRR